MLYMHTDFIMYLSYEKDMMKIVLYLIKSYVIFYLLLAKSDVTACSI